MTTPTTLTPTLPNPPSKGGQPTLTAAIAKNAMPMAPVG